jgi:hypothetical protein
MPLSARRLGFSMLLLASGATVAPGCTSDDAAAPTPTPTCHSEGGPVAGPEDTHCVDSKGDAIVQAIGKCVQGAPGAGGTGGAGDTDHGEGGADSDHEHAGAGGAGADHEHAEGGEEPFEVRYNDHAADDDCKYDTSFSTSCLEVNKPVTLTLKLRERASGNFGKGAVPNGPEIYLADEPGHISPSLGITATEGPSGQYAIKPIIFDVSGRWVVRFHYFEECSDVPEDSPHGHVAFYVDVP